ncbi:3-deoxy-manno-octulosonate cytidylyltransferase [Rhizobium cauense]|uniref:3-deoxy-manno-octulosonate cytidylyltransferase n=1 Tax=Rhizobium cauense TaxID=1166683 RepID=UPI001C6E5EDD|nr:3-deoxy-manno-octulosonate cytidylyltransferase [Rhizobium cauense]MBW9114808.1 3-deoxy-manno-octulosonate cytidylyltransferase [Rhizobium cauense]
MDIIPSQEMNWDGWKALFQGYSHIVLVANSDEVNISDLTSRLPETTLFIFFNKVYKVLNEPFLRPALLVTRSGTLGSNLVKSGKVSKVLQYFDRSSFLGIVNLAIGEREKFSPASEFGDVEVRHLDLTAVFSSFYPPASIPTSGFALAFWLAQLQPDIQVTLAGFSSKRSERYQVLDVHDWTFEQVVLRLMYRRGEIDILGRQRMNPYAELSAHFPQYSPVEVALTANEVLAERLVNLSSWVDKLMHVTRILRFIDRTYRRFKPATRNERKWAALESQQDPSRPVADRN